MLYKQYLFHWERSQTRENLPREVILQINPYNLEGPEVIDLASENITDSQAIFESPVVLLRNFELKNEEEMMKYLLSEVFKRQTLTCKPQDPRYIGLSRIKPEKTNKGKILKMHNFIHDYYNEEEKEGPTSGQTFYGIGAEVNDLEFLKELDNRLK